MLSALSAYYLSDGPNDMHQYTFDEKTNQI
jgi:hypothetical protein